MKLTTLVVAVLLATASAFAQQVTKKEIAGISTFAQVETTIACGGATKPEAIREVAKMGFKSVINLRLASEQGAMVEEEGAAVKAAGMNYVHLPFDAQNPDAHLIDNFIAAVTASANQPAYVHCAAGGRAASLWMVKRVLADGWDEQRALTVLGLEYVRAVLAEEQAKRGFYARIRVRDQDLETRFLVHGAQTLRFAEPPPLERQTKLGLAKRVQ